VKQSFREGRHKVGHHRGAAAGLAEDRHVSRIAAERGDIVLDPPQRELLVHDPVVCKRVALGIDRGMPQEAERSDPVVQRHHDHVAAPGKLAAVVIVAFAAEQASAIEPDHDGLVGRRIGFGLRRENVEIEAVLGGTRRRKNPALRLRTGVGELRRKQGLRPPRDLARRLPAEFSHWRRGERDAKKLADSAAGSAPLKVPRRSMNDARQASGLLRERAARRSTPDDGPKCHV
jgi:hypothetical protein